jgi:hypothetical protein
MNVNFINKTLERFEFTGIQRHNSTSANKSLAKMSVKCSADNFVVNQSLVLCINFCAKKMSIVNLQNTLNKPITAGSANIKRYEK